MTRLAGDRGSGRQAASWLSSDIYRTVPERLVAENLMLGGWAWTIAQDQPGCMAAASETLARFVAAGLPFRDTSEGRAFDIVEVLNFSKVAGLAGSDPYWEHFWVATGRQNTAALAARTNDRVHVTLRRRFELAGLAPGNPLRLRLPIPVRDAQIADLTVTLMERDGFVFRPSPDATRIEARGPCPAAAAIELDVTYAFTCRPEQVNRDDHDLARFLEASEGLIQVTPRVQALASELASALPPREAVSRFHAFMLDHLMSGAIHYDRLAEAAAPTDWVLQTGWFDCQLGGALLAALCRASGIPARLVGGYYLHPLSTTPHSWVEVWIADDGWLSFDLGDWDLSLAGRDAAWRNRFAGAIEPRLKTEVLPLHFTGRPSSPLPARWQILHRHADGGTESALYATDSATLIHSDWLTVRFGDQPG